MSAGELLNGVRTLRKQKRLSTQRETGAAAEAAKVGACLPISTAPSLALEARLMLLLPPCVMHAYYKTKHLQTLVLLALNMLFSSFKNEDGWLCFSAYLCQVCAAEEQ